MFEQTSIRFVDHTRVEFSGSVTDRELRELADDREVRVLQCAASVAEPVWSLVNTFFAARPDVELRIYGHYSQDCDLGMLRHMTNVRRFAADRLVRAHNVGAIAELPNLECLSLGILGLRDFDVLNEVSPGLTELSLGSTRSKAPSLSPLARFRSLKTLYLEGHTKDIEVLGGLRALEDVTLRSISTLDLGYLAPLERLWSLDVKLGGIRSFAGIEGKASIKYLELWQVRELRDIGIVSALPGLQNLFLQSLPHIGAFPSVGGATALRRVILENLKKLHDFSALERAPGLEEFGLIDGKGQNPEQLVPVLRNPAVRRVSAFFGSARKNQHFARMRDEAGKVEGSPWGRFEYR